MDQEQQDPNTDPEQFEAGPSKPKELKTDQETDAKEVRRSGRVRKPVERLQVKPYEPTPAPPPRPKRPRKELSRVDQVRLGILHNKTWYGMFLKYPPGPNMVEVSLDDISGDSDYSEE